MTDNEIIKALECCAKSSCKNCPENCGSAMCLKNLVIDSLDLINSQQAEIERLQDFNENLQTGNTALSNEILEIKSEAIKEFAERLKGRLTGIGRSTIYGNFEYGTIKSYEIDDLVKEMTEEIEK